MECPDDVTEVNEVSKVQCSNMDEETGKSHTNARVFIPKLQFIEASATIQNQIEASSRSYRSRQLKVFSNTKCSTGILLSVIC